MEISRCNSLTYCIVANKHDKYEGAITTTAGALIGSNMVLSKLQNIYFCFTLNYRQESQNILYFSCNVEYLNI